MVIRNWSQLKTSMTPMMQLKSCEKDMEVYDSLMIPQKMAIMATEKQSRKGISLIFKELN